MELSSVKIAIFTPMPNARRSTVGIAKLGDCPKLPECIPQYLVANVSSHTEEIACRGSVHERLGIPNCMRAARRASFWERPRFHSVILHFGKVGLDLAGKSYRDGNSETCSRDDSIGTLESSYAGCRTRLTAAVSCCHFLPLSEAAYDRAQ